MSGINLLEDTLHLVLSVARHRHNVSNEATIPWVHRRHLLVVEEGAQVRNQILRIVVENFGHPTGPDTITAVHQNQWQDRDKVVRLDGLTIIIQIVKQGVILLGED